MSPNSHIFVRPKSGDYLGMCDYLGTMWLFGYIEDSASKGKILILDFDFCFLFEKYFLIKKTAFGIYQIFVNRENEANKKIEWDSPSTKKSGF